MLYDLNSYINNVRVILHACNNYLKVNYQSNHVPSNTDPIILPTVDRY